MSEDKIKEEGDKDKVLIDPLKEDSDPDVPVLEDLPDDFLEGEVLEEEVMDESNFRETEEAIVEAEASEHGI